MSGPSGRAARPAPYRYEDLAGRTPSPEQRETTETGSEHSSDEETETNESSHDEGANGETDEAVQQQENNGVEREERLPRYDNYEDILTDVRQRYRDLRAQMQQLYEFTQMEDNRDFPPPPGLPDFTPSLELTAYPHQVTSVGLVRRQPTLQDIKVGLRTTIIDNRREEDINYAEVGREVEAMVRHLKEAAYVTVRLMRGLCSKADSTLPYSRFPSEDLKEFIMQFYRDLLHNSKPQVHLDECQDNWMARYYIEREWNTSATEMRNRYARPRPHHGYNTRHNPPPPETRQGRVDVANPQPDPEPQHVHYELVRFFDEEPAPAQENTAENDPGQAQPDQEPAQQEPMEQEPVQQEQVQTVQTSRRRGRDEAELDTEGTRRVRRRHDRD